ncbi:hypothetical protein N9W89_11780 [Hellea sp.]|nr:hypothetical protein [Hellea sp.]
MNDNPHNGDSGADKPPASMTDHYIKMVKQAHAAEQEAVEATARAKDLRTKIEAVKKVLLDSGFPLPDIETRYIMKKIKRRGRPKKGAPTWGSEIISIVQKHGYISYGEIRDILAAGPMGPQLALSEKGFYGAMRRANINGDIIRYNSYAFTPDAFKKYQDEVERGVRSELEPSLRRGSNKTIPDIVLESLGSHPLQLTAKEICDNLGLPNIGTLYNVLKKLNDAGHISRDSSNGTYWHSKYQLEPKTATLPMSPSREGELPLNEPADATAR